MRSSEERCRVIGEGEEEDGEKSGKECGETRIVDEVEEPDLRPRLRRSGKDLPRLPVVHDIAGTHDQSLINGGRID